jgi:hypothetical protein
MAWRQMVAFFAAIIAPRQWVLRDYGIEFNKEKPDRFENAYPGITAKPVRFIQTRREYYDNNSKRSL